MSEQTKEKKTSKKSKILKVLGVVLLAGVVVGSLAWGAWSYKLYQDAKQQLANLSQLSPDDQLSQAQVDEILAMVRTHMLIPENEEAIVATIVDVDALVAEQPFYTGAENGDYVIILPQSQKAIIYSPSRDIIVNVGPVSIDETAQQPVDEAPNADVLDETLLEDPESSPEPTSTPVTETAPLPEPEENPEVQPTE